LATNLIAYDWNSPATPAKVAAVCYRLNRQGAIEFLLVRTASGRWTFPKGGVDGDASAAAAAAREAFEEAGVRGRIEPSSFTRYLHHKRNPYRRARAREIAVEAYLCRVLQLEAPLEIDRDPTWFSASRAKRRLRESRAAKYGAELERVVDCAVERISKRLH
jgi:8-oxo-dGTP pyrophosphatase MutT (NUDIX family)